MKALERRTAGAAWEAQEAVEAGYGARISAMCSALRRAMRAPAPDVAALAVKIALLVDHDVANLSGGEACLAAIKRDARRLAGER